MTAAWPRSSGACQELPGQDLLQYFDEAKALRAVSSGDVNDYLRSIAGYGVTAKDFRTWAGTVLAARFLTEAGGFETIKQSRRMLREAIGRVAAALGNTPTVCRKSYIHPAVIDAWRVGKLVVESGSSDAPSGQRPEEAATLALLRNENALRSGRGESCRRA